MNCNSFLQGHYNSTGGLNFEANGSSWPDKIPLGGYDCSGVSSFPFSDQSFDLYIGALRSTLLKHEAVFKDQLQELHRVYWRQKELMEEMKGTKFKTGLYVDSDENSSRNVYDTSKQVGLDLRIGRKRSNEVFNLELQDPVKFSQERVCEGPEIVDKPLGKLFGFQITSDGKLSTKCPPRNSDLHSSNLADNFGSFKTKCLLDLNEPIKVEEAEDSESNDFVAPAISSLVPSNRFVDEPQEILHEEMKKARAVSFSDDEETGIGIDLNSSPEDSCNGSTLSRKRSQPSIKTSCPVKKSKLCLVERSDLEAPVSPENKESARPSVESDNNQASQEKENSESSREMKSVKTEAKLDKKELDYLIVEDDEQKRTAAEIILDISSSCSGTLLKNLPHEPKRPSFDVSLAWFATIALAVNEDSKSKSGFFSSDCEENSFPHEMDYFEAMTLRLTEIKQDDQLMKTENARTEFAVSNLSRGSMTTGSSRRGKRNQKNFQNEVLTSISSLSSNEVTAGLQTIRGLIGPTGTKLKSVSTRKKKIKNANLSRKKQSCDSKETILSSCDKIGVRTDMVWGKITRRARGPRNPAAKYS